MVQWDVEALGRTTTLAGLLLIGCEGPEHKSPQGPRLYRNHQCELVSVTMMEGPDEVAPNGRTGAELIAGIPAVRVGNVRWAGSPFAFIDGAGEAESRLEASFHIPAAPVFEYEDHKLIEQPPSLAYLPAPLCLDYLVTYVRVELVSEDQVLRLNLKGVRIQMTEVFYGFELWLRGFPEVDDRIEVPQLVVPAPPPAAEDWGVRFKLDLDPAAEENRGGWMGYISQDPAAWIDGVLLAEMD